MEKALKFLVVTLIIAAGLQIAGVNLLMQGYTTIQLPQPTDWSGLNTAAGIIIPLQF
jgi:hypothetical protein